MFEKTWPARLWRTIAGWALALFLFAPIAWLIRTAFTPDSLMFTTSFHWLPSTFSLANFSYAIDHSSVLRYMANSLVDASGGAIISTVLGVYAAYGLVTFQFRLSRTMMVVFLLAQGFPVALILVRLYPMFVSLGLTNSRIGIMIAYAILSMPAAVYIMHSFLVRLPKEFIESARVDGCGELAAFHRVVIPVIKPALAAVWLFSFMWGWNDLLFSVTLLTSGGQQTLGPGLLTTYLGQFNDNWGGIMAASLLVSIPVVALFVTFQRWFVRGIMAGAIKG